jgi:hypothetical protein
MRLVKALRSAGQTYFVVCPEGVNIYTGYLLYKATPTGVERVQVNDIWGLRCFGECVFVTPTEKIDTMRAEKIDREFEIILSTDGQIDQIVEKSA